jgi:Cu/Ag efflux protein CusF
MKISQWHLIAVLMFALILAGCNGVNTAGKGSASGNVYDIKGKVTAVDANKEKPTVRIDHEDIPGLMRGMEMTIKVEDAKLLEGIQVGDQVQGKLEKRETGNVIIKLEKR